MKLAAKHITTFQEAASYINDTENFSEVHPIVLLDIVLPGGSGVGLARVIAASPPMPHIIAITGGASPEEAFRLKEIGVKAFLSKPFTSDQFKKAINEGLSTEMEIDENHIASVLGAVPLKSATTHVRKTMLTNALQQTHGNITKSGELLKISRQGVQNMITEFDINIEHYKINKE